MDVGCLATSALFTYEANEDSRYDNRAKVMVKAKDMTERHNSGKRQYQTDEYQYGQSVKVMDRVQVEAE